MFDFIVVVWFRAGRLSAYIPYRVFYKSVWI